VRRHLFRQGNKLMFANWEYDLSGIEAVWLVGAGKAGAPMALAAAQIVDDSLKGGVVIVKEGHLWENPPGTPASFERVSFVEAGHPIPDERGVNGTRKLLELMEQVGLNDLVICLISGGGSALMTAPAPDVTINDLQTLTRHLLASGADISEINCLRKHLDEVKGGGLARRAAPANLLTLILSDVVGDPLDVIASGPTVPDSSTFDQAWDVLEKYNLLEDAPPAVVRRLEQGRSGILPETPKQGDPIFDRVQNVVVGSNHQATEAALIQASREGLHAILLTTRLQGEARTAGKRLASLAPYLNSARKDRGYSCLVAGGETTVTIRGEGLGGRNQELALGSVETLAGIPGIVLLSLATDGGDGPTGAAGAVVTGETYERALNLGLDPLAYLTHNDSYHFFLALDDLLITGPTLTNVNDLTFLFAF
jgi:glycerate 2-kinase